METALRRLVLVRHGETVGESSTRYHGVTDVALNEVGVAQMNRVRGALAEESFDLAITSALQRTIAAAAIVAPAVPARALPGFNEIDFGDWEGLTRDEIARRDPERYAAWQAAGAAFTYPNGDAVAAFRGRVAATWRRIVPQLPARVIVIAHKGVMGTILGELLHLAPAERATLTIDLASIHILGTANGRGWVADVLNDVRHLGEPS